MTHDGRIDVTFAGATVRFEHRGRRSARIVRFYWRDVRRLRPRSPFFTIRLEDDETEGALRLTVGGRPTYHGPSEEMAAACLLDEAMYHLADRSRSGLVLHAGGAASGEGAVLLPGTSGSGKTTLTSWLVSHGWRYLTDELVFIATGSSLVQGLARPLNVKDAALPVLREFVDLDAHLDQTLATPQGLLLRPSVLGNARPAGRTTISRLVFPHYVPRAAYALTPLSPAKAGARLMGCLVNARNLDGHGFPEVTRLVRKIPAYELRYGSITQLAEWRR
jgi:hypothetical protein